MHISTTSAGRCAPNFWATIYRSHCGNFLDYRIASSGCIQRQTTDGSIISNLVNRWGKWALQIGDAAIVRATMVVSTNSSKLSRNARSSSLEMPNCDVILTANLFSGSEKAKAVDIYCGFGLTLMLALYYIRTDLFVILE